MVPKSLGVPTGGEKITICEGQWKREILHKSNCCLCESGDDVTEGGTEVRRAQRGNADNDVMCCCECHKGNDDDDDEKEELRGNYNNSNNNNRRCNDCGGEIVYDEREENEGEEEEEVGISVGEEEGEGEGDSGGSQNGRFGGSFEIYDLFPFTVGKSKRF